MRGLGWATAAAAVALAQAARGDAPLIDCHCQAQAWPPYYAYHVDAASFPMLEFVVGTNDLNPANYAQVISPPGWRFTVEPTGLGHSCGLFTPHGQVPPPNCESLTLGRVRWWTDDPALAVESFTFAFSHPWPAEDVGWTLTTRRPGPPPEYYVFSESWSAPVGTGAGPVHGPYAEYCWSNADCGPDRYCWFHVCAAETGVCVPRPGGCPDVWQPVCGCDGVTYGNACEAAAAGMSIDHPGTCVLGDLDCDSALSFYDIDPFVLALAGDEPYYAAFPDCYRPLADCNADGQIDFDDVDAFVALLASLAPHLGGYGHDGCVPLRDDGWCPPDTFTLTPGPGQLHVTHDNATYNCCLDDIVVTLTVAGTRLRLRETEVLSTPCYCLCCYTVQSTVLGLAPGACTVEYCWHDQDTGQERCHIEHVLIP